MSTFSARATAVIALFVISPVEFVWGYLFLVFATPEHASASLYFGWFGFWAITFLTTPVAALVAFWNARRAALILLYCVAFSLVWIGLGHLTTSNKDILYGSYVLGEVNWTSAIPYIPKAILGMVWFELSGETPSMNADYGDSEAGRSMHFSLPNGSN